METPNAVNPYSPPRTAVADTVLESDQFPELRYAKIGLQTIYLGILLLLVLVIVVAPLLGIFGLGSILIGGLVTLTILMIAVGTVLCGSVPRISGARYYMLASLVCQWLGIATCFAAIFSARPNAGLAGVNAGPVSGENVGSLLLLTSFLLFIAFMRQTARYIGRVDLQARGTRLLVMTPVMIVLFMAAAFIARSQAPLAITISWIAIPLVIAVLMLFVMFANLVSALAKAIDKGRRATLASGFGATATADTK